MKRLLRGLLYAVLGVVTLVALALAVFAWQADRRETQDAAQAAPATGRFVPAADVSVYVQEAGPADGMPVLFVHGTGAWSETWRDTLTALAQAGYRAIAIDLPPFGYSQRPQPPLYTKAAQGRRIVGALDALGIDRAILVGHSFGGGPTVEAALLAPERVRALVLVDAALAIREDGGAPEPSPAISALLSVQPLRDALVATFLTNPQFTRKLLQSFIADPAKATAERVRVYQQPLAVRGSTRAIGAWLPALLAAGEVSASELPATYRKLAMPACVIWGNLDTITPPDQGRRVAGLLPAAQLLPIEGVGHIPQIEAPRAFNELLLRCLDSVTSRPAGA
jgi:pimeloyl-ACP methyl ester carboxylesterase